MEQKMSKSAFVVDTPNRCVGCFFCENEYVGEDMKKEYVTSHCHLNGHEIKNIESKPDWCPLRPLPEKRLHTAPISNYELSKNIFANGWNACLDEITGGEVDGEIN